MRLFAVRMGVGRSRKGGVQHRCDEGKRPPISDERAGSDSLAALPQKSGTRIASVGAKEETEALALIDEVMARSGVPPARVLAHLTARSSMRNGRVYRDPETGKVWAGRGRKPNWIKAFEASGGNLPDLAVSECETDRE